MWGKLAYSVLYDDNGFDEEDSEEWVPDGAQEA